MKKLVFLLLPIVILAQSFIISDIPLPRTYIQNLDPYECTQECLQQYVDDNMIFSFLSYGNVPLDDETLQEARNINMTLFNMAPFNSHAMLKIAMLLPSKKIGKYAATTTNASFAYLLDTGNPFMLKSYNIDSENKEDIQTALNTIQEDGFTHIIAPFTTKGVNNVIALDPQLSIYFPTINKKDVNTSSPYLNFGGIDYRQQSDLLLQKATTPLVIFSDKSSLGHRLANYQKETFTMQTGSQRVIPYFLSRKTTNLEPYLKKNKRIVHGSFFINTPIIKSGMILSQLTLYDTNATNILSTQINYNPLLLSMTQYVDRKHMIVANSLTLHNNLLIETNALLGNDIVYDWINYSTTVGVDYFYSLMTGESRKYPIPLENHQMHYSIELLKPSVSKFTPYTD